MKFTASTGELLAQLQTVARVSSTRAANPALSGVQLAATADGVELRATDTEISLRVPLQAQVAREGVTVLPARLVVDVARSLKDVGPEATVELRAEQQDVELVAGHAKYHLRTLRSDDFPPLPETGGDTVVDVPAAAFVETIAKVARSASKDETRPTLTGILVSAEGSELRMVATDSYRLAVKRTALEQPLNGGFEANVPARALGELPSLVEGTKADSLRVGVRSNQVVFEVGGAVLSSRLIDGQFPNHSQLIPDQFEHELPLSGEEVGGVVRRIALLALKNSPVKLAFREGELVVSAETQDVGEASEPLPVPFQGEAFEIGFNPEFLRDGLESVGSGDFTLKLISPLRPGLIQGGEGGDFLYLIMPIRLNV